MRELPSGTVTLLFTDIEGSTRLLQELGRERYVEALTAHRRLLREAFGARGGVEVEMQGDSFFFAFPFARDAVAAAAAGQQALASHRWEHEPIRVRIGLHSGEPVQADGLYAGLDVHRAARVMSAAHGGQVVISARTAELADGELPTGLALRELGRHRLKDLPEPILLFQLGDGDFPPLRTLTAPATNLPGRTGSLVGRRRELRELHDLVGETRLLTLTGPGGCGKTRLALEAAAELVPQFEGVFWVRLEAVRDPALVAETIAQTLGAKDGLREHVGERRLLLVLDNFEQVVGAAPELAALLAECPRLKLLVTSRELLRVRGELEYRVPPLAAGDGVDLFCARARCEPDDAVAAVCDALDQLPLALELAAARVRVLSPQQILERLSQRLDLLQGGRDAEPRQKTLRAAIEWSHDLLDSEERTLFARLSVFRGGSTLDAAETVCDADLDTLQSLVDKSLVIHGGERFSMLETIHEYAVERLAASLDADEVPRRHAEWALALAEQADTQFFGREQGEALARLTTEIDNLRAALAWALEESPELALRLCGLLGFFWYVRGHWREAKTWCDRAAAHEAVAPPVVRGRAVEIRGLFTALSGDAHTAIGLSDQALAVWRTIGDAWRLGQSLLIRHVIAEAADDAPLREAVLLEAIAVGREAGHAPVLGIALGNLADLMLRNDEPARVREVAAEAASVLAATGDDYNRSGTVVALSWADLREGDLAAAAAGFREALAIGARLGAVEVFVMCLCGLGAVAVRGGEPAHAARLLGAVDAHVEQESLRIPELERRMRAKTLEQARTALGDEAFRRELAAGAELTLDQAAEVALRP